MRRRWFIAAIALGVFAIVVAAIAMRLSDDDGDQQSTSEWADSVCTSLATWQGSITSLADVSGGTLTPESLGEKLDDAESATSQLVSELQSLGPPDLDEGDELQQELDDAAAELESSFETLKQGAEDATQADSPAAFLQELAALAPQFQALLDTLATTVDDLENANVAEDSKVALQQAFADSASCQQLQASS